MHFRHSFSSRSSTTSLADSDSDSLKSSSSPAPAPSPAHHDDSLLWHRMLALQRRFHCYNSARMSAALQDQSMAVPPRACLDLLNDSIATADLCDEARAHIAALSRSRSDPSRRTKRFRWR